MDERADRLGMKRMRLISDSSKAPRERCLIGELLKVQEIGNDDDLASALVQEYRMDEVVKGSVNAN